MSSVAAAPLFSSAITNNSFDQKHKNFPAVLATWNNEKAVQTAYNHLLIGKSGLDALISGIKIPEADAMDRSVGYGGRPDRAGNVTLDACIMDNRGNAGSVSYVQGYKHPIEIARRVMEKTPHVMLVGDGVEKFAKAEGFTQENLLTAESKKEYDEWLKESKYQPIINIERHDTIGMVLLDKGGEVFGGCSTSGMAYKMEGRVGDSPIIGAGLYVDNAVGAATCSGHGEYALRTNASFLVVEFMRNGMSPEKACKKAIQRIMDFHKYRKDEFQIGLIAINKKGEFGGYSVVKNFSYYISSEKVKGVFDTKHMI